MKRLLALLALCAPLSLLAGCAMCCAPFDYSYPTYGGKWQRVDREHGRVGSLFTPHAGVRADHIPPDGEPVMQGEVTDGELIEGELIEGGIEGDDEMTPPDTDSLDGLVEPARLIVPIE